jgi:tetratricopeptide (TPR) repeat protein
LNGGIFFMRINILSSIFIFFGVAIAQQSPYRSADDIKQEWVDHTSHQRGELVSFCDFLFQEGHYERCLLSCFQFMYRFPGDPIEPVILYHIARSYEEMENYDLALTYYKRSKDSVNKNTIVYSACQKREAYVLFKAKKYEALFALTEKTKNPYYLIFRSYALIDQMDWGEARQNLLAAKKQFNHAHYSRLIDSLFPIINQVQELPQKKKVWVAISGALLPGGGHLMLDDNFDGAGIFFSMATIRMMMILNNITLADGELYYQQSPKVIQPMVTNFKGEKNVFNLYGGDEIPSSIQLKSTELKYALPPIIIGLGIYGGSLWQALDQTQESNRDIAQNFILEKLANRSVKLFIDFKEPLLIKK